MIYMMCPSLISDFIHKPFLKKDKMAPLTLNTGSTGFIIGSKVSVRVLEAGYRVRLVVNRAEQADKLRRIFAAHTDKWEFCIVLDLGDVMITCRRIWNSFCT